MNCKYCSKTCKNIISLRGHEIRCSENPNKIKTKISEETKKKISAIMKVNNSNADRVWKKETIEKLKIISREENKKYWTKERREEQSLRMSKIAKERPDSYSINNVCGRVKIFEYNGFKLKGNWELKVAKLLDENNIKWTNIIEPFPYFWNNNWHLYFPDFYLPDFDVYIEVKGFQRERDLMKWKSVNKLIILKKKEIELLSNGDKNIKEYIAAE
jgi:hypothetical protein